MLAFLAPYLLLVVGYCTLDMFNNLSNNQSVTLRLIPYSLFVVSACISLYFGRSRIFYLSLLMALLHWVLTSYYPYIDGVRQHDLLVVLGVLAPLNLVVLSLIRDRGLALVQSYLMASALGLQSALVVDVMNNDHYVWLQSADHLFAMLPLSKLPFDLPSAVLVSLLLSAAIISVRLFFRSTPLNNALLVILVTLGITFHFVDVITAVSVLLVVAGLVTLLCLMQHSYDMAYRDELTGLLGRRALTERFLRLSGRYCIVMVDVDYFKKFNDNHGHDVGDQVLKMLAGQLDRTGDGARAYRYGGEEFVLIFENKVLLQIAPVLEKLRLDVADYPMKIRSTNRTADSKVNKKLRKEGDKSEVLSVTISLGAAQHNDRLKTPTMVMEAADKSLYRAKNTGRNKLVLHK